ncbi:MAG: alanine--tRNA ligase [Armatimonadota bacterium]|nr:alanine--tRNA ligase [Armatimonadota bacterium]MDR7563811.1 alanine--tRNA ligase [Armatimonadota bacterium]MDR7567782.1 alanine--tRNA ligase [Armatimonadota bacterium]MDR7600879.1 alanine--tRNA ligase [Armatimonadota bacterium]
MSWTSKEIRETFLRFFEERGHVRVPSISLIPDDPTLLFTNSGMVQFKDVFLGTGTRPYRRVVDVQKCMRVSGKHNDLEDVGRDGYHHTFFEMLGNWSFGDYYKREAIAWAWELLTQVWGLPPERLWATCFEDELGEIPRDDEAAEMWLRQPGFDPSHLLFFGRKENFWEMAEVGPCGPDSEIHIDRGPVFCNKQHVPGHTCRVNGDCERFLELWNLVFIQYNRTGPTTLEPLPAKHVDTGMGLERITSVLQGGRDNYDTDLFLPLIRRTQELVGHSDAEREAHLVAYRVIADHARAAAFLIADGVVPGNEGRNYVLRMILRRAARFGRTLGLDRPFLAEVADVVVREMGDVYPELRAHGDFVREVITREEERFAQTLDAGMARLEEVIARLKSEGRRVLGGEEVFRLYDTYGFPREMTQDIAQEHGLEIDWAGFELSMAEQRERARAQAPFRVAEHPLAELSRKGGRTEFVGYRRMRARGRVVALVRDGSPVEEVREGEEAEVVLDRTPFYAEAGGQVGDRGQLRWRNGHFEVTDTQRPVEGLIVHRGVVVQGTLRVGQRVEAAVDELRREDTMRHHTATHLLHKALREILGEHARQAGSLVAPERLRFDFLHLQPLSREQLRAIEDRVNEHILKAIPVRVRYLPYEEAIRRGAVALFGEKYGDVVRMVSIGDYSRELCGGTHVRNTGEIGSFWITQEVGVASGVRRIEAVCGRAAIAWQRHRTELLEDLAAQLRASPEELPARVERLQARVRELERTLQTWQRQRIAEDLDRIVESSQEVEGVRVAVARLDGLPHEALRAVGDRLRERLQSGVIVLGGADAGRVVLVAMVTRDLVHRVRAPEVIRPVAERVGGSGGGRPELAQAGGRDPSRLDEALGHVPEIVRGLLRETAPVGDP